MNFKKYAKYYNAFNSTKLYKEEVLFILSKLKKYSKVKNKNLLDIGCGTGLHTSVFSDYFEEIIAIDLSNDMLESAIKRKNISYKMMNLLNLKLNNNFSVITSLFHVLSYQIDNYNVNDFFANISSHLLDEGFLIFDFWFSPAVNSIGPSVKVRRYEDNENYMLRLAEPVIDVSSNVVDVNFEFIIKNKATNKTDLIKEQHKMRHFSIPEIEFFLKKNGFVSLEYFELISDREPSLDTWSIMCIAQKIS